MPQPSASVVIPTYNRAPLIARAIRSVQAAITPGDEIIVVDDGSTDDTERVLQPLAAHVRYVKTANGGAGKARNRGVAEARHPLVAFLDSDDEWMPDRLLLGRRLLAARPDVLFCFSDFGLRRAGAPEQHGGLAGWHEDPRPWDEILGPGIPYSRLAELPPGRPDFRVHLGDLYGALLDRGYVAAQTLLVRRDAAGDALRFAEDLRMYEDWECAARLARAGPAAYLDTETAWQWGHTAPRLTDADRLLRATSRIRIIERVWGTDPAYLARDGAHVAQVLREQRLVRAKNLLLRGDTRQARATLGLVPHAPAAQRLLACMPGPVVRGLLSIRSARRS